MPGVQVNPVDAFGRVRGDRARDRVLEPGRAPPVREPRLLPRQVRPIPPLSHTKFFKVVSQKSIPTQIRQLVLYISTSKG